MSNHYNPDWLGDDALLAGFVARQSEFTHLHDVLARMPLVGSAQHYLLVGVRGAGKTTLLKRLAVAIRQEASLSDHLIALSFPEELYQVKDLNDFWWASCEALADELDRLDRNKEADQLLAEVDAAKYNPATKNAGFTLLQSTCAQLQKRPVLLVDNLDFVFQRIDKSGRKLKDPHAAAYWTLREQLSTSTSPIVIGGSVRLSEPFTDYDKAFYDFFIPKRLGKLGLDEVKQVLERLADAKGAPEVKTRLAERPSRLETLYDLTGGNPRAIGLVFQLLNQNPSSRAIDDFGQLMDITTPYYKARFEDLPEQAQVVMHALAVRRPTDAAGSGLRFGHTAAEIAAHSGLVTSSVSAQLDNMDKEGLIEKSNAHGRVQYRIAEQLFRLWLQMRGNRRIRQNVMGLAEFLEAMFNADELMASKTNTNKEPPLANARYAMALSGVSQTQHLRSSLEAQGMDGVMQHLDSEGGELRHYVGDGDVSADLQALTALHEQLKKCKPRGLNADEQEALIGSVKLTLAKKQNFVSAICTPEAADKAMLEVREHLAREQRDLQRHGLLEADLKPFFHARLRACLPLPNFTPADAANTISYLGSTPAIRSMVWRVMGLRRMISIKDEAAAMEWLHWGDKYAGAASATEWANVAGTMRWSNYLKTAQVTLDKAIAKGECARTWFEKAALLKKREGSIEHVEGFYQKALKLNPADAFIWNNFGLVLRDSGRLDAAESAFKKAVDLDPSFSLVRVNLGMLLGKTGRIEEAIDAYQIALNLEPDRQVWIQIQVVVLRTQLFAKKAKQALTNKDLAQIQTLLAELQKDVPDLSEAFATYYFVEDFLVFALEDQKQAVHLLALLREMNAERFARPLLLAFEAAVSNRPDMLTELEPELQRAAQRMYERLTMLV